MRIPLLCAALVLATAACDRRDDPDVDPANTGTLSSPGDRTTTTPDAATDPYPASADPSMPPATGTSPTGTDPTGTSPTGTDPTAPASQCVENDPNCVDPMRDPARDPTTTPPPAQQPTQ